MKRIVKIDRHPVLTEQLGFLPLLNAAMRNCTSRMGLGSCFEWSVALALDCAGSTLVVGDLGPSVERRMLHAWVETSKGYIAPTLAHQHGALRYIDPAEYHAVNDIRMTVKMDRCDLVPLMARIKFTEAVLTGRDYDRSEMDGKLFATYLLDGMGMPHGDDGNFGVIPKYAALLGQRDCGGML